MYEGTFTTHGNVVRIREEGVCHNNTVSYVLPVARNFVTFEIIMRACLEDDFAPFSGTDDDYLHTYMPFICYFLSEFIAVNSAWYITRSSKAEY